jgi:NTP pyrophosphatase (non-canonical NTP hydrolase)
MTGKKPALHPVDQNHGDDWIDDWFTNCQVVRDFGVGSDVALYSAVGLAGETGEVCELIKKSNRDGDRRKPIDVRELAAELGDVMFYLAAIANEYSIPLKGIIEMNIAKRTERGWIEDRT